MEQYDSAAFADACAGVLVLSGPFRLSMFAFFRLSIFQRLFRRSIVVSQGSFLPQL